jgi:hypothetical protein
MDSVKDFLIQAVEYIGKRILIFNLGIAVIVALSFIFTRDLNANTYSDRMVWAGIIFVVLGGLVVLGVTVVARDFGIPPLITRPEHAKKFVTHQKEIFERKEKRYNVAIQLFVIGLVCVAIGALVQITLGSM